MCVNNCAGSLNGSLTFAQSGGYAIQNLMPSYLSIIFTADYVFSTFQYCPCFLNACRLSDTEHAKSLAKFNVALDTLVISCFKCV